jgi:hypothetical protein
MLVYTLANRYTLDLCSPPKSRGDDFACIHALRILAKGLGLRLYSTVLSYHIVATFDMAESKGPEDGKVVEKRSLETLISLDSEFYCPETEDFNECRGMTSTSLEVLAQEILQKDSYTRVHTSSSLLYSCASRMIIKDPERYFHQV